MSSDLEQKFEVAMRAIQVMADRAGSPHALDFKAILRRLGGVGAAKTIINAPRPSPLFLDLCKAGREDLTIEAVVVRSVAWRPLFTPEEIDRARTRLRDYGTDP